MNSIVSARTLRQSHSWDVPTPCCHVCDWIGAPCHNGKNGRHSTPAPLLAATVLPWLVLVVDHLCFTTGPRATRVRWRLTENIRVPSTWVAVQWPRRALMAKKPLFSAPNSAQGPDAVISTDTEDLLEKNWHFNKNCAHWLTTLDPTLN